MTTFSLTDVLAVLRPDVDADILLVRFHGGATHALTIREIVVEDAHALRFDRDADGATRVTLHSKLRSVPAEAVASLRTVTFAEFVGQSSVGSM